VRPLVRLARRSASTADAKAIIEKSGTRMKAMRCGSSLGGAPNMEDLTSCRAEGIYGGMTAYATSREE
jgi:hypothetical protein